MWRRIFSVALARQRRRILCSLKRQIFSRHVNKQFLSCESTFWYNFCCLECLCNRLRDTLKFWRAQGEVWASIAAVTRSASFARQAAYCKLAGHVYLTRMQRIWLFKRLNVSATTRVYLPPQSVQNTKRRRCSSLQNSKVSCNACVQNTQQFSWTRFAYRSDRMALVRWRCRQTRKRLACNQSRRYKGKLEMAHFYASRRLSHPTASPRALIDRLYICWVCQQN